MMSVPVSFDFCTSTNGHNGALNLRLMCYVFMSLHRTGIYYVAVAQGATQF